MTESEWLASEDPQAMLEATRGKVSDRKLRLFACNCVRQGWHLLTDERSRNAVKVAERFADGLAIDSELDAARDAAWTAAGDAAWTAAGDAAWTPAWTPAGAAARAAAGAAARAAARAAAWTAAGDAAGDAAWTPAGAAAGAAAGTAARAAARAAAWTAAGDAARAAAWDTQAHFLRDIVGNPFRRVVLPHGKPCKRCRGEGTVTGRAGAQVLGTGMEPRQACPNCQGVGYDPCPWLTPTVLSLATAAYEGRDEASGHLDLYRLAVLADSLEEAGCVGELCAECGGDGWRFEIPPMLSIGHPLDRKKQCEDCQGRGRLPHPLLAHLRSPGPHVRGCWAIDLVLGRE